MHGVCRGLCCVSRSHVIVGEEGTHSSEDKSVWFEVCKKRRCIALDMMMMMMCNRKREVCPPYMTFTFRYRHVACLSIGALLPDPLPIDDRGIIIFGATALPRGRYTRRYPNSFPSCVGPSAFRDHDPQIKEVLRGFRTVRTEGLASSVSEISRV